VELLAFVSRIIHTIDHFILLFTHNSTSDSAKHDVAKCVRSNVHYRKT